MMIMMMMMTDDDDDDDDEKLLMITITVLRQLSETWRGEVCFIVIEA